MGLRRKTKIERDLAALAEKVEAARSDLEARRVAEHEAEAEHRQTLDALAGDLGLGDLDEAQYESQRAEADEALRARRYERERAEAVERAVSARAADLAEEIWSGKVEAAEADEARAAAAVEEAESALAKLRAEEAAATERLAIVRRRALDARSGFDEGATAAAEGRAQGDANWARWYVRSAPPGMEVPPERREAVEAAQASLEAEDAAYRERLRARPDFLGPARDADGGLAEAQEFPVLPAPR